MLFVEIVLIVSIKELSLHLLKKAPQIKVNY